MNIDSFLKTNASKVTSFVIIKNKAITSEALVRNISTVSIKKYVLDESLNVFIQISPFTLGTAENYAGTLLLILFLMIKVLEPAEWDLSPELQAWLSMSPMAAASHAP